MKDKEQKPKEYEVQYSVKWVNFTATVQAISEEEAVEIAEKEDAFVVTVRNEVVYSLEDIFKYHGPARVECMDEEDEDEEEEESET